MTKRFRGLVLRFLLLVLFLFSSLLAICQPPPGGSTPGLPTTIPTVPPINQPNAQFQKNLEDGNKPGDDLNKQKGINKDSLIDERGIKIPMTAKSTYGSNEIGRASCRERV